MYHWQKIDRHFLVLLSSACLVLSPSLSAKAQQMTIAEQPHTNTPVAQTQTPTNQTPRTRRPRTAFFEEERRQFGFGDFLSSALDGNDNTFSTDPVKVSAGIPRTNPPQQQANNQRLLTLISRDSEDPDFVNITYVDPGTNTYFGLAVTEADRSQDYRIGSVRIGGTVQILNPQILPSNLSAEIPVNGVLPLNQTNNTNTVIIDGQIYPVTIDYVPPNDPNAFRGNIKDLNNISVTVRPNPQLTINGNEIPITSNVRVYNVGASYSGSPVSGVVLITNPDDPSTSIYIQLPPTAIPDTDDSLPVSGAAFLSIGRPTDR